MKIKDQYMKVGRRMNRSRKPIYHILQRNMEARDSCLCGAIIFDTNGWNIVLDDGEDGRRVSVLCEKAYNKTMRVGRWKQ
jgi:hypothetical protein